jgi:hypothetical protein
MPVGEMTVRGRMLRYCAAVALVIGAQLAGFWFHSSGVYPGRSNVPLRQFPQDVDLFFVLTFAPTIIGLKYLVYEFAVRAFTGKSGTRATGICFYAGYAIALAIDMMSIFSASKPIADAGLAVLGTVTMSPLVLIAAGGVIAGYVLWKDRPPSAVAR